jgi:hypothetical protein
LGKKEPFQKWTSGKALKMHSFRPNPLSLSREWLFQRQLINCPVGRGLFNGSPRPSVSPPRERGGSGLIHLFSSLLSRRICTPTSLHPPSTGVTVSRPLAAAVYSFRFGHHIICLLEPDRCFDAEAHIVLYQSREIFSTGVPVCTSHHLPLVVSESDLAVLATWPSILHQW